MKKLIFLFVFFISAYSSLSFSQYRGGSYDGYYSILDTNTIVGIENSVSVIENFNLYQNYPNPFNPKTIIHYYIRNSGYVTLKIYDVLGNEVATLIQEKHNGGLYEKEFDATNFPSGVYFYKLVVSVASPLGSDKFSQTKKMLLTK